MGGSGGSVAVGVIVLVCVDISFGLASIVGKLQANEVTTNKRITWMNLAFVFMDLPLIWIINVRNCRAIQVKTQQPLCTKCGSRLNREAIRMRRPAADEIRGWFG